MIDVDKKEVLVDSICVRYWNSTLKYKYFNFDNLQKVEKHYYPDRPAFYIVKDRYSTLEIEVVK